MIDAGVYRKTGPARVFGQRGAAIAAVKGQSDTPVRAGDILVVIAHSPLGSGMEETYQLTAALRYLEWGKQVAFHYRRPFQRRQHRRMRRPCGRKASRRANGRVRG